MRGQDAKLKVLVADDEPVIAETMALILNFHGFEVTTVSSGEAAVEEARSFCPDFLVSDIRMGEMDGIEAAIRIKHDCPGCKIVVFSATILDHGTRARIRELGFHFLRKPIHPDSLLAHLKIAA